MKTVLVLTSLASLLAADVAVACHNGLEVERKPPDTLLAQSRRAYNAGRFTEAASKSALALSAPGSDTEKRALWRTHGLACLKIGNLKRAVESLTSLSQHTKEPFIQVKLAEAQLRLAANEGRLEASAQQSLEALAERGLLADADAWTALATARLKAGSEDAAKAACKSALQLQPGHEEATKLLASVSPQKPSASLKTAAKS